MIDVGRGETERIVERNGFRALRQAIDRPRIVIADTATVETTPVADVAAAPGSIEDGVPTEFFGTHIVTQQPLGLEHLHRGGEGAVIGVAPSRRNRLIASTLGESARVVPVELTVLRVTPTAFEARVGRTRVDHADAYEPLVGVDARVDPGNANRSAMRLAVWRADSESSPVSSTASPKRPSGTCSSGNACASTCHSGRSARKRRACTYAFRRPTSRGRMS